MSSLDAEYVVPIAVTSEESSAPGSPVDIMSTGYHRSVSEIGNTTDGSLSPSRHHMQEIANIKQIKTVADTVKQFEDLVGDESGLLAAEQARRIERERLRLKEDEAARKKRERAELIRRRREEERAMDEAQERLRDEEDRLEEERRRQLLEQQLREEEEARAEAQRIEEELERARREEEEAIRRRIEAIEGQLSAADEEEQEGRRGVERAEVSAFAAIARESAESLVTSRYKQRSREAAARAQAEAEAQRAHEEELERQLAAVVEERRRAEEETARKAAEAQREADELFRRQEAEAAERARALEERLSRESADRERLAAEDAAARERAEAARREREAVRAAELRELEALERRIEQERQAFEAARRAELERVADEEREMHQREAEKEAILEVRRAHMLDQQRLLVTAQERERTRELCECERLAMVDAAVAGAALVSEEASVAWAAMLRTMEGEYRALRHAEAMAAIAEERRREEARHAAMMAQLLMRRRAEQETGLGELEAEEARRRAEEAQLRLQLVHDKQERERALAEALAENHEGSLRRQSRRLAALEAAHEEEQRSAAQLRQQIKAAEAEQQRVALVEEERRREAAERERAAEEMARRVREVADSSARDHELFLMRERAEASRRLLEHSAAVRGGQAIEFARAASTVGALVGKEGERLLEVGRERALLAEAKNALLDKKHEVELAKTQLSAILYGGLGVEGRSRSLTGTTAGAGASASRSVPNPQRTRSSVAGRRSCSLVSPLASEVVDANHSQSHQTKTNQMLGGAVKGERLLGVSHVNEASSPKELNIYQRNERIPEEGYSRCVAFLGSPPPAKVASAYQSVWAVTSSSRRFNDVYAEDEDDVRVFVDAPVSFSALSSRETFTAASPVDHPSHPVKTTDTGRLVGNPLATRYSASVGRASPRIDRALSTAGSSPLNVPYGGGAEGGKVETPRGSSASRVVPSAAPVVASAYTVASADGLNNTAGLKRDLERERDPDGVVVSSNVTAMESDNDWGTAPPLLPSALDKLAHPSPLRTTNALPSDVATEGQLARLTGDEMQAIRKAGQGTPPNQGAIGVRFSPYVLKKRQISCVPCIQTSPAGGARAPSHGTKSVSSSSLNDEHELSYVTIGAATFGQRFRGVPVEKLRSDSIEIIVESLEFDDSILTQAPVKAESLGLLRTSSSTAFAVLSPLTSALEELVGNTFGGAYRKRIIIDQHGNTTVLGCSLFIFRKKDGKLLELVCASSVERMTWLAWFAFVLRRRPIDASALVERARQYIALGGQPPPQAPTTPNEEWQEPSVIGAPSSPESSVRRGPSISQSVGLGQSKSNAYQRSPQSVARALYSTLPPPQYPSSMVPVRRPFPHELPMVLFDEYCLFRHLSLPGGSVYGRLVLVSGGLLSLLGGDGCSVLETLMRQRGARSGTDLLLPLVGVAGYTVEGGRRGSTDLALWPQQMATDGADADVAQLWAVLGQRGDCLARMLHDCRVLAEGFLVTFMGGDGMQRAADLIRTA